MMLDGEEGACAVTQVVFERGGVQQAGAATAGAGPTGKARVLCEEGQFAFHRSHFEQTLQSPRLKSTAPKTA